MATIAARENVQSQAPNQGAIIKKRSALPTTTRLALGDLNKNITGGGGLQRQKGTTSLRKPIATKQPAPTKVRTNIKSDASKKPTASIQDTKEIAKPAISQILKSAVPDSPVAMLVGTPSKEEVVKDVNVFDTTEDPDVENIDENDTENPQLCSEFVNDIYHYMLYLESEYPIRKLYLKDTGLKGRMRSILVDWLIQVHHRFNLLQETLYLTVAILDRFLQVHPVPRVKLQLAGVTAMLLASKYEEMYAPEVNDYVYITDKAFTQSQILDMEILILKTLDFSFGRPLPLHFLRRNSKAGQVDASQHTLAKYLMELSLVDYDMCHVEPSRLAAGALCLSIKLLEDADWSRTLQHYSRYSKSDLEPVVCHLAKNLKAASTNTYQQAVKSKYSSQRLMRISQIQEIKLPVVSELAEKASSHQL